MNHHPLADILEFNYITDGIYIGTNMCCQSHFDNKLISIDKIEVDISLEAERVEKPFGVKVYMWLPVQDNTAPTLDQFELGVTIIEKSFAMKKNMYIHCKSGFGRSPTLVAAYLIKKGKTVQEAIDFIKQKRPTIHPNEIQITALENFEKSLRQ